MKSLFPEIPVLHGRRVVLRRITMNDLPAMQELVSSSKVYRWLPAFLYEKSSSDMSYIINTLYTECINSSLMLGIYSENEFCGIAEMYGYIKRLRKISVGYRLLERAWGKGLSTDALKTMADFLCNEKGIEMITASSMIENKASARVLEKCGFRLAVHAVREDWGFPEPILADKWVR